MLQPSDSDTSFHTVFMYLPNSLSDSVFMWEENVCAVSGARISTVVLWSAVDVNRALFVVVQECSKYQLDRKYCKKIKAFNIFNCTQRKKK